MALPALVARDTVHRRPAWITERRRPRVLLAWEHGRNFGRLSRLLAIARMVEQQGGEPVWVVPRSQHHAPALVALSQRREEAPVLEQQTFGPDFRADSFADVLLASGFDDAGRLFAAVEGWTRLIDALAPECVVLDYAPAAQLTSQLLGLPAFQITNGFDAPPPDCPPYAGVRATSPLGQRTAERVARLSDTIAQVGQRFGGPHASSLSLILRHPRRVFECIPETDPYGPRHEGLWVGPLATHAETVDVPWPESWQRRRVFAHLRSSAGAVPCWTSCSCRTRSRCASGAMRRTRCWRATATPACACCASPCTWAGCWPMRMPSSTRARPRWSATACWPASRS